MYSKISLDDVDPREIEDGEPTLLDVGYELRPEKMRPSVREFEAGGSNNRHGQRERL